MNAVIYTRFSTDKQQSTEAQIKRCLEYAQNNNLQVVNIYSDEDASGTNTDRVGFSRMIEDAKKGMFNAVIIYDVSRGSRDVGDWFDFRKMMLSLNIKVFSATENLGDYTDPNSFLTELITVGLGQHMVLQTREKSIYGKLTKAKEGLFMGGYPPLGYDIIDRKYVINEYEANIVRLIFDLYAKGKSYDYILNQLKEYKSKRGRPFGKNSLQSILHNEKYIGVLTYNKYCERRLRKHVGKLNEDYIKIKDGCPRIIDDDTFAKVVKRLNDNKRKAVNKAKRNYLLSGKIECAACGASYIGRTSTNKKGFETGYYVCGDKYRKHTCNAKNINQFRLEEFVTSCVLDYLNNSDFEDLATEIARKYNVTSVDLTKEKKELAEIRTKISNGINAILSGINIPELQSEIDRLQLRKGDLEDIIAYKSSHKQPITKEEIIDILNGLKAQLEVDIDEAIKSCVHKIYAYPDGSYTVEIGVVTNGSSGRA